MEFEEISNYYTEDEGSDCEIEVCDNDFVDITSISTKYSNETSHKVLLDVDFMSNFEKWWPETAKIIIQSMYSSRIEKNRAISKMMESFDYKHNDIEPIKMISEGLHELHSLYKSKLEIHATYLNRVKNGWCDIIRSCGNKCKQAKKEKINLEQKLASKANELYKQYCKVTRQTEKK